MTTKAVSKGASTDEAFEAWMKSYWKHPFDLARDELGYRNGHVLQFQAVWRAGVEWGRTQPPAPVFRDLSTPIDPQIAAYELLMSATPLTTEEIERMERMRLALQIDRSVFETIGEAHCPKTDSIPETATISNINLICPPGVNQTEFAGGWNDSRQFALTHGTVPPVIKGIDARAQGWNACSGRMTLCEANQNGC